MPVAERPVTRGWPNKMMRVLLRTPGLDRVLGRSVALIAFEGRKTGKVYETPLSYARVGDAVVVLSRSSRMWWRNLRERPAVRLHLAGKDWFGRATVRSGGEAELATVLAFLQGRRFDARAYGVPLGPDGKPSETDVRELLPGIVVIRIELTDVEPRPDEAIREEERAMTKMGVDETEVLMRGQGRKHAQGTRRVTQVMVPRQVRTGGG